MFDAIITFVTVDDEGVIVTEIHRIEFGSDNSFREFMRDIKDQRGDADQCSGCRNEYGITNVEQLRA